MTNETLKLELHDYIELCYDCMDRVDSIRSKRTFYDHAFGAISFMCHVLPDADSYPENLWNEWKPKFEDKIFGGN